MTTETRQQPQPRPGDVRPGPGASSTTNPGPTGRRLASAGRLIADRGATMVEYTLLVVIIAIAVVGAWRVMYEATVDAPRDAGSQLLD